MFACAGIAPNWEDITGSTQLKMVKNCVTFSTTVSAKYWLVDTSQPASAVADANKLYQAAASVPYMARCYVFVKPHGTEAEACENCEERQFDFRVFVACEDVFSKSLETQERFIELSRSEPFELRHGTEYFVELTGNLVAVHAGGDEQVPLRFAAFADNANRLAFAVRTRDVHARPSGAFAISRHPKATLVQQSKRPDLFRPAVTLQLDLGAAFGWNGPENSHQSADAEDQSEHVDAEKSHRHLVAHQSIRKPEFANDEDRQAALGNLADALCDAFAPAAHEQETHRHQHDDGDCHSVNEEQIAAVRKQK